MEVNIDSRYFIWLYDREDCTPVSIGNSLGYCEYDKAKNYLDNVIEQETDARKLHVRKYVISYRVHNIVHRHKLDAAPSPSVTRYFIARTDRNSTYEVLLTRIFSDEDAANQFSHDLNKKYGFRYSYKVRPMTFTD